MMLLIALAMGGCQTLSTVTDETACDALGKPIIYNSKKKESDYYAAPKLAPQLAEKNRTGINLNCPAYSR
jgi:hypothetical protein